MGGVLHVRNTQKPPLTEPRDKIGRGTFNRPGVANFLGPSPETLHRPGTNNPPPDRPGTPTEHKVRDPNRDTNSGVGITREEGP